MMEVGDRVTWDGKIGEIVSVNRPKCKCKGKGHYMISVGTMSYKVPITTKLEKYEPIGLIDTNIPPHTL